MQAGIDPTNDYAFKRMLGSETPRLPLVDLLNALLGLGIQEVQVGNPFSEKEHAGGKVLIFDIKAKDQIGRQFHLEMQRGVLWSFPKRLTYYLANRHGTQMLEGDFYETLMPTYSIGFLNKPLDDDPRYHRCYRLLDGVSPKPFCADLELHVIELPKFTLAVEEVSSPLERWCYFFKNGASLDNEHLPATLDVPAIRQALEVLIMLSRDEIERMRVLDIEMARRDAANLVNIEERTKTHFLKVGREEGLEQGMEKGMEKGLEKGMEKGMEKGEIIGQILFAQKMLKQAATPREELQHLPVAILQSQLAELERALWGSNGTS